MSAAAPFSQRPSPLSSTPRLGFVNMTINFLFASLTSQLNQRNYNEADVEFNRRLLEWIADSNELKCVNRAQRFKLFVAFVLNLLIDYLSSLDRENEDVESKLSELCQLVFDDRDDEEESLSGYRKALNDLRCLVYQHVDCLVDIDFFNESSVHKQSMIEIVEKHSNLRANSSSARRPEIVETTSFSQIVVKMNESREQLCRDMREYIKTHVESKSSSVLYQLSKQYDQLGDQDGDEYQMISEFLQTRQRNESAKQPKSEPPLTPFSTRGVSKASNEEYSSTENETSDEEYSSEESEASYEELSDTESEQTSRATSRKNIGGQTIKRKPVEWSEEETQRLREVAKKFRTVDGKIDWEGILAKYKKIFVNRDNKSLSNKWQSLVKRGIEKPLYKSTRLHYFDETNSELSDTESEETSRATSSNKVFGQTRSRFARWSDAENRCLRKNQTKRKRVNWSEEETKRLREEVKKMRSSNDRIDWEGILNNNKKIFVYRDNKALSDRWHQLVKKGIEKPLYKRTGQHYYGETHSELSSKKCEAQRKPIKLRWSDEEKMCLKEGVKKFSTYDGQIDWGGILNEYREVFVNRDRKSLYKKWSRSVL